MKKLSGLGLWLDIKERHYYLIDKDGSRRLYVYSRMGGKEKLLKGKGRYDHNQISQISLQVGGQLEELMNKSALIKEFWTHATDDQKEALLLSFYLRKLKKSKKVLNVEIASSWLEDEYFGEYFDRLKIYRRWKGMWRLKTFLLSLVRTTGKHALGLRFDNVHLTVDYVGDRIIYGVHWDNYAPKPLKWSQVMHLLKEDIAS